MIARDAIDDVYRGTSKGDCDMKWTAMIAAEDGDVRDVGPFSAACAGKGERTGLGVRSRDYMCKKRTRKWKDGLKAVKGGSGKCYSWRNKTGDAGIFG